jgi:hypothetical protein
MRVKIDSHPNDLIKDVKLIRINGVGAGYCGIEPNSPICFLAPQSDEVKEAVRAKVEKAIGGSISKIHEPPTEEDIENGDDD